MVDPAAVGSAWPAPPGAVVRLWCWRHPRAQGAAGRCIGRTDLPVDRRKAKRLAHRIRQVARRDGLPRVVWVSPLQRACDVGRCLARWGWRVQVDERLAELHFGAWDGAPWTEIPWREVGAWQADLLQHAPGGGESIARLAQRVQSFVADVQAAQAPCLVVTHGGWITALLHVAPGSRELGAAQWPDPPRHGSLTRWPEAD